MKTAIGAKRILTLILTIIFCEFFYTLQSHVYRVVCGQVSFGNLVNFHANVSYYSQRVPLRIKTVYQSSFLFIVDSEEADNSF